MERRIFLLYSCDVWKGNDSMRLVMATTDRLKITEAIKRKVRKNDMEYSGILREMNKEDTKTINTHLTYGYIQEISDGEYL